MNAALMEDWEPVNKYALIPMDPSIVAVKVVILLLEIIALVRLSTSAPGSYDI